jgi:hypothetical protein
LSSGGDGYEVFGQRLSPSGSRVGGNVWLSNMGPEGDAGWAANEGYPAHFSLLAADPSSREYLVGWSYYGRNLAARRVLAP